MQCDIADCQALRSPIETRGCVGLRAASGIQVFCWNFLVPKVGRSCPKRKTWLTCIAVILIRDRKIQGVGLKYWALQRLVQITLVALKAVRSSRVTGGALRIDCQCSELSSRDIVCEQDGATVHVRDDDGIPDRGMQKRLDRPMKFYRGAEGSVKGGSLQTYAFQFSRYRNVELASEATDLLELNVPRTARKFLKAKKQEFLFSSVVNKRALARVQ